MSDHPGEEIDLRKRLVQQIRETFPGVLAISPEQFASLAGKERVWGYRRIWSSQVKALGTKEGGNNQSYQILIEEAAAYFASNSKVISNIEVVAEGKVNEASIQRKTASRGKKKSSKPEIANFTYVVTLLDKADSSILMQYVRAQNGLDAGNYALCFDEQKEEREEGYQVVSVLSAPDFLALAKDATISTGPCVPSITPSGDRSWARGSLISG